MASPQTTTPPLRKASSWRIMQIIIYLTAVAFSIGTLVGYKGLNSLFNQDMHVCILYATPSVTAKESPKDCEVSLDKTNTRDHTCSFVYFNVISSVVYAIIGCWFFIACTSDAKTRPDETVIQSWKLVVPAIFFTSILTLLSVVSSSLLTGGVADFTKSFSLQSSVIECQQFKLYRPENATLFMNEVHLYRTVAELFTWLSTAVWLLAVIILTCRCCLAADFITTNSEVGSVLRKVSTMVVKIRQTPPTAAADAGAGAGTGAGAAGPTAAAAAGVGAGGGVAGPTAAATTAAGKSPASPRGHHKAKKQHGPRPHKKKQKHIQPPV